MEDECSPARPLRFRDVEMLRDRWDEGRASGRAGPLDIKRIIGEERPGMTAMRTGVADLFVSRRYTLDELLAQCDPQAPVSEEDRAWLDAPRVGGELL